MSTAKRSRQRQSEGRTTSPQPAPKRLKTAKVPPHVPRKAGLEFLVDEDARAGRKLQANLTNGVPRSKSTRLDESHAVVAQDIFQSDRDGDNMDKPIELGDSDVEEDFSDDDVDVVATNGHITPSDDEDDGDKMEGIVAQRLNHDEDDTAAGADEDETGEPSFGDVLRARHPETIDVQASFADPSTERSALIPSMTNRGLSAPSGNSLGTVLTQALKTNDRDLLESCFQVDDMQSVRATIERLNSQLIVTLLQRLAERIHKRPGRTQKLMVWVQWSLVVHGGYLASQPALMKKLKSLSQVVRERASGLQPLLHLKGKLDLLWAQLDLQKKQQRTVRGANSDGEDEENVIYVEGKNDDVWSDEEMATPRTIARTGKEKAHGSARTSDMSEVEEGSEDESDELPTTLPQYADDSEDEEHSEEEDGMLDVEAEETDDDEGEDLDNSDDESDGEGSESEDEDEDMAADQDDEVVVSKPAPRTLNRKR